MHDVRDKSHAIYDLRLFETSGKNLMLQIRKVHSWSSVAMLFFMKMKIIPCLCESTVNRAFRFLICVLD